MARRRRNPSIYPSEAAALRALLSRHGYSTNPGARPGENDIPTVRIKRGRNPKRRRKVKMFGPGKRWRTKRAMVRYLAKIRVKAMRALRRRGKGRKVKARRRKTYRRR